MRVLVFEWWCYGWFFKSSLHLSVFAKCLLMNWASLVAQLVKKPPAVLETWVWSLGWEDPLEKGKATHSSILAWRIPQTVESMGSQNQTRLSNFHFFSNEYMGFPGGPDRKESACNARDQVWSLGQEDLLEKDMAIHSNILVGESHGQRSLVDYSPWGRKKLDITEHITNTHFYQWVYTVHTGEEDVHTVGEESW